MNNDTIIRVLSDHFVTTRVECGRVMALDDVNQLMPDGSTADASNWVDVTGYSEGRLKRWLGY